MTRGRTRNADPIPTHPKDVADQRCQETTLQMTPTAIAAFVSLALCLAFAETRWIGIVVVVVLGYFFPMLLLAAAVIALLAACAFHYF
jgi:hypothetical protein